MDSFKNIYPLLDRLQIQKILVRLQELSTERKPKLRAPYSLKVILIWLLFELLVPFSDSSSITIFLTNYFVKQVDNFHDGELDKHLAEANLSFPLIVKPQVACGVADAHNMV